MLRLSLTQSSILLPLVWRNARFSHSLYRETNGRFPGLLQGDRRSPKQAFQQTYDDGQYFAEDTVPHCSIGA